MRECDKHGRSAQLLLCLASDADGSTFRLCGNQDEAMAFYKEMWGEDLGGGIQSQIDHFSDEDNWSHGMTEYSCDLYCSTFRVWRVDRDEVSLPSCAAATSTPSSTQTLTTALHKYRGGPNPLAAALFELVDCKNLKDSLDAAGDDERFAAERAEYERRKPLAWAEARRALTEFFSTPSAKVPSWIPVSERLPDPMTRTVVGFVTLVADKYGRVTQAEWDHNPVDGKLTCRWPQVTHWMPLPAGPQARADDTAEKK